MAQQCQGRCGEVQAIAAAATGLACFILRFLRRPLMARRPYRIVLLDCAMPGMDGIECAQRLTELGGEVPTVLMVTGFARDEVLARLRTLEATVRMVLTKPVTPSTLHDACLGVLNDRTEAAPALRRASGIDFEHHRTVLEGTHVLLVEDNEINQELAVDLLSRVGVRVTVASRGEQALELLAQHPVDGVLMDCQMPGMDGYETTRRIRAHAPWQGLPVIAMTANVMQGDRENALLSGMNDHVGKPIDVDELYRVLARWLTPHRRGPRRAGAARGDHPGCPGRPWRGCASRSGPYPGQRRAVSADADPVRAAGAGVRSRLA